MPLLIAPIFNSVAEETLSIDIKAPFQLISGSTKLYDLCYRKKILHHEGVFPPVAYRRHMLSLEKESFEDQLLNLWIALIKANGKINSN